MRRTNVEASEGTVQIVRRKRDLEYFTHEAQRSVDCRSVYKEPVQQPERIINHSGLIAHTSYSFSLVSDASRRFGSPRISAK